MSTPLATDVAKRLRRIRKLNAASLRVVRRDVSRQVAEAPARAVINLAVQIVEEAPPLAYAFAYELIRYHATALAELRARDLQRFGKQMQGWGDVDAFAYVAGVAWRNRQVADAVIHRWARSGNRWWRRAALVSTVPLNVKSHGGRGDARRTLAVCRLLLEDRDDMVVKAMSWALRALAVREPRVVTDFVRRHEHVLARRVVREVQNKLRTGRKDGRQDR
ncbi:MAG: DNA alkylation repair protein [Planctomycetota bacterium]|jgi:3-methyladenine DNA glycosylase AlkD